MHDLNPVKLSYYSLMISLDKCSGNFSTANDLSTKICVRVKQKTQILKAFNIIKAINEGKTLIKLILYDCKCKCNSKTCYSNQKWKNKTCQCEC